METRTVYKNLMGNLVKWLYGRQRTRMEYDIKTDLTEVVREHARRM